MRLDVTAEQQELLTDLIIEERTALRESRKYVVDADLPEWDERYADLGVLLEEVTGHPNNFDDLLKK